MDVIRWGIIGCGDVTEVKSGPGFQKASGSRLVAVMRRDRARAEDYARRHGVGRVHDRADDLLADPEVDAVYIATPPDSHCELALRCAAAGKPCLVEKPMALNHPACLRMVDAFSRARVGLWVAYYRRALDRFLTVRALLTGGAIGRLTCVHVELFDRLATGERARTWRFDPAVGGGGLFLDMGSHAIDLLDFLVGAISNASGFAVNSGGAYAAEDVTAASFEMAGGVVGTGVWNFNADRSRDAMVFTGTEGELRTPVFQDGDVTVTSAGQQSAYPIRNPPHVHQPLIQSIVDELCGRGHCTSTGESAARASWVIDRCLETYRISSSVARAPQWPKAQSQEP
jgi:1,5-anhydro-D-fructose reductase (1,5-anhydro-D-mannitol-forming)